MLLSARRVNEAPARSGPASMEAPGSPRLRRTAGVCGSARLLAFILPGAVLALFGDVVHAQAPPPSPGSASAEAPPEVPAAPELQSKAGAAARRAAKARDKAREAAERAQISSVEARNAARVKDVDRARRAANGASAEAEAARRYAIEARTAAEEASKPRDDAHTLLRHAEQAADTAAARLKAIEAEDPPAAPTPARARKTDKPPTDAAPKPKGDVAHSLTREVEDAQRKARDAQALLLTVTTYANLAAESADDAATSLEAASEARKSAEDEATAIAEVVDVELRKEGEKRAEGALCGRAQGEPRTNQPAAPRSMCFFYGIFTASLSRVSVFGESGSTPKSPYWGGETAHQIAAIVVPVAGVRLIPFHDSQGYIALDLGAYSSTFSPRIRTREGAESSAPEATISCSRAGGEFEKRLPCEGNVTLNPYLAGFIGVTIGRNGLGYLSAIPFTIGFGTLGREATLRGYYGWTVGFAQLHGRLP